MTNIMVVDDDKGALKLIEIMLSGGGFSVSTALSAEKALEKLDSETPDLIILDIMMPGMNGIELCAKIRARESTAETPVLILSSRSDSTAVLGSVDNGATDYMPKPVIRNELVAKVNQLLSMNAVQ